MRSKALAPGPRPPGTCRCRDVSVGEARTASRLGFSPQEPRATATCAASSVPGLVAGRCRGHAPRERPPGSPHSAKLSERSGPPTWYVPRLAPSSALGKRSSGGTPALGGRKWHRNGQDDTERRPVFLSSRCFAQMDAEPGCVFFFFFFLTVGLSRYLCYCMG